MAVLTKVNLQSNQRLDLPDLQNIENFAAEDFNALVKFILTGDSYVVGGLEPYQDVDLLVDNPTASPIYLNVAGAAVLHPNADGVPFMYVGSEKLKPIEVNLTADATNYVELDLTETTSAPDTRTIWDPQASAGEGAEFSQIVDTAKDLTASVTVNQTGFSGGSKIPLMKITLVGLTITEIEDARDHFFRLGKGDDKTYKFSWDSQEEPDSDRKNDPNAFIGGDKQLKTLKDFIDAVLTEIADIKGSAYWYTKGSHLVQDLNITDIFVDALASVMTSKGQFSHSSSMPGLLTWDETIFIRSILGDLHYEIPADSVQLDNKQVAYIQLVRNEVQPQQTFQFTNGLNTVLAPEGAFVNFQIGDWIKPETESQGRWRRITNMTPADPNFATEVTLDEVYDGATTTEKAVRASGTYTVQVDNPEDVPTSGQVYWIAKRDDNGSGSNETSVQEVTNISCVADVSSSLNNTFFLLSSTIDETKYYVWYNVDGLGTDPLVDGRTAIEVAISADDIADAVAAATQAVLDAMPDFNASVTTNVVELTHAVEGDTEDVRDGSFGTGFGFTTSTQGESAQIYLRGKLQLEQGEERSINDNFSEDAASYVGMKSETDSSPDYTHATGTTVKNIHLQDGDNLTRGIKKLELRGDVIPQVDFVDTESIALPTTAPLTLDGVAVVDGDIVLYTQPAIEGIYKVSLSGGSITFEQLPLFGGVDTPTDGFQVRVMKGTSSHIRTMWERRSAIWRPVQIQDVDLNSSGVFDRAQSTLSFDNGTRTFTITPTSDWFDYFVNGRFFRKTSAQSVVVPDISALYHIYFDGDNLTSTATFNHNIFDAGYCFIGSVYWNAILGEGNWLADQRHTCVMDNGTKDYLNSNEQVQIEVEHQDLRLTELGCVPLSTHGGSGSLDVHAQIEILDGTIRNEDLRFSIRNDAAPSNDFEQILSPIAQIPVFYKSTGIGAWVKESATQFPVVPGSGGGLEVTEIEAPFEFKLFNGDYFLINSGGDVTQYYVWINNGKAPTNEIQGITFDFEPDAGFFRLSFKGQETNNIPYNANAAFIESELENLSTITSVSVSGDFANGFSVEFTGVDGLQPQPIMSITTNTLEFGGSLDQNEIQDLTSSNVPSGGDFVLAHDGNTTGNIPYNVDRATLQTVISSIPSIDYVTIYGLTERVADATINSYNAGSGRVDFPDSVDLSGVVSAAPGVGDFVITGQGAPFDGTYIIAKFGVANYFNSDPLPSASLNGGTAGNSYTYVKIGDPTIGIVRDRGNDVWKFGEITTSGKDFTNFTNGTDVTLTDFAVQTPTSIIIVSDDVGPDPTTSSQMSTNIPGIAGDLLLTGDTQDTDAYEISSVDNTPGNKHVVISTGETIQLGDGARITDAPSFSTGWRIEFRGTGPGGTGNMNVNEIEIFSSTLTGGVVAGQNEIQEITFSSTPISGSFILSQDGNISPAINFNDDLATIKSKIESIAGINEVTVTGAIDDVTGLTIEWTGLDAETLQNELVVDTNNLVESITPGTDQVQRITFDGQPVSGTWDLIHEGNITNTLQYNIDAATLEDELEALPSIGVGNVAVTALTLPDIGFEITFQNALGESPQTQIQINSANLLKVTQPQFPEVQVIEFSDVPTVGTWTFQWDGEPISGADINAYNINASALETQFRALTANVTDTATIEGSYGETALETSIPAFTYDNATGFVLVDDSVDLSDVTAGHVLEDNSLNRFYIMYGVNNTPGQKGFYLPSGLSGTIDTSAGADLIASGFVITWQAPYDENDYILSGIDENALQYASTVGVDEIQRISFGGDTPDQGQFDFTLPAIKGREFLTITNAVNLAGDTITVDGTSLVEGVDWIAKFDAPDEYQNETALNLAASINSNIATVKAWAEGNVVWIESNTAGGPNINLSYTDGGSAGLTLSSATIVSPGAQTSNPILFSEGAAEIQSELLAMTGVSDVVVAGSYAAGFTITFQNNDGRRNWPQITINSNTLQTNTTAEVDEIQRIAFGAVPNTGTWTLRHDGNDTTTLDSSSTALDVENALLALASIDAGGVSVSGDFASDFVITFQNSEGGENQPQITVENNTLLSGATLGQNEIQRLSFSAVPDSGAFALDLDGEVTTDMNFNDVALNLENKIKNLPSITSVSVTGSFASDFVIEFDGVDGETNFNPFTIDSNTLLDGVTPVTITPSTDQNGVATTGGTPVATVESTDVEGSPETSDPVTITPSTDVDGVDEVLAPIVVSFTGAADGQSELTAAVVPTSFLTVVGVEPVIVNPTINVNTLQQGTLPSGALTSLFVDTEEDGSFLIEATNVIASVITSTDGQAPEPTLPGLTGIEVVITTGMNPGEVAQAIKTAIDSEAAADFTTVRDGSKVTITTTAGGVTTDSSQGNTEEIAVLTLSNGTDASNARIKYNPFRAGAWQLDDVTEDGKFIEMYIFATTKVEEPIVAIMGQQEYDSLADAQKNNIGLDNLDLDGLDFREMKLIWKLIYKTDSTYTNSIRAVLSDAIDFRFIKGVSKTIHHSDLRGLDEADHGPTAVTTSGLSQDGFFNGGQSDLLEALQRLNDGFGLMQLKEDVVNQRRVKVTTGLQTFDDKTQVVSTIQGYEMGFDGAEIDFENGVVYDADGVTVIGSFTPTVPAVDSYLWYGVSLKDISVNAAGQMQVSVEVVAAGSSGLSPELAPKPQLPSGIGLGFVNVRGVAGPNIATISAIDIVNQAIGASGGFLLSAALNGTTVESEVNRFDFTGYGIEVSQQSDGVVEVSIAGGNAISKDTEGNVTITTEPVEGFKVLVLRDTNQVLWESRVSDIGGLTMFAPSLRAESPYTYFTKPDQSLAELTVDTLGNVIVESPIVNLGGTIDDSFFIESPSALFWKITVNNSNAIVMNDVDNHLKYDNDSAEDLWRLQQTDANRVMQYMTVYDAAALISFGTTPPTVNNSVSGDLVPWIMYNNGVDIRPVYWDDAGGVWRYFHDNSAI